MAKTQERPVSAPTQELADFSSVIQSSLEDLFTEAHDHRVLTSDPAALSGNIGDVLIVDDQSTVYLVTKTSRGWFKSPAFTAI